MVKGLDKQECTFCDEPGSPIEVIMDELAPKAVGTLPAFLKNVRLIRLGHKYFLPLQTFSKTPVLKRPTA
jgi:hypothetical protein